MRTFLIADVRGYTQFTVDHGDEAAAKLAVRFASAARQVVSARDGRVVEVLGDEALAVFFSTRQALWASVELNAYFARESEGAPPIRIGVGLDAGEAIPVDGGYRGAALNLGARLCSLAGPGEVLATDTVTNLARKVDGLAYIDRGSAPLKGFADPVKVLRIQPAEGAEERSASPAPATPDLRTLSRRAPQQQTALAAKDEVREQVLPIGGFLGSLPDAPLVARETDLGQILATADMAAAAQGQTVLLAGEPGAGKTRLAQEVTLELRNRGFLIVAGRCYEAEQGVPYYPFLDAERKRQARTAELSWHFLQGDDLPRAAAYAIAAADEARSVFAHDEAESREGGDTSGAQEQLVAALTLFRGLGAEPFIKRSERILVSLQSSEETRMV